MAASDAFYNDIVNEIAPLFTELGTSFTVRTPDTYDEDELETVAGSTRAVQGLVADQQTTLAIAGDAMGTWVATKTLILRQDAAPLAAEEIQVDSKWFSLSKVVPVKPADITVVYLLDISR